MPRLDSNTYSFQAEFSLGGRTNRRVLSAARLWPLVTFFEEHGHSNTLHGMNEISNSAHLRELKERGVALPACRWSGGSVCSMCERCFLLQNICLGQDADVQLLVIAGELSPNISPLGLQGYATVAVPII